MQADVEELSIGFDMNIPPPYRLKAGTYRGSITYRIGPGGDFDFGNDVSNLSGDSLTVNFELDVQHAFMFEFPPGSERAVLEPRNGWQVARRRNAFIATCRSGCGPQARSRSTSSASTTRARSVPSKTMAGSRYLLMSP
ncbi:hypothetical protein LOY42_06985 [Pseudomonas sp. B21-023]|uniref:hypothetical protein n=1 Tax=unclassified Pseudomonas TaxID=196821 RepID=UPI00215EC39F|nr:MULTISPECIES: hypothetical protein [unclassified Pseudomonas]UVL20645.1 hypothetical protein LOY44_07015 [Pseudomonas sp. B21-044]UVM18049.1 hypothetical protein LOY42_06985 [Pseudomonas sp. B21-023]